MVARCRWSSKDHLHGFESVVRNQYRAYPCTTHSKCVGIVICLIDMHLTLESSEISSGMPSSTGRLLLVFVNIETV